MQYFREIGKASPLASRESLAIAGGRRLNFALGNPERIHLVPKRLEPLRLGTPPAQTQHDLATVPDDLTTPVKKPPPERSHHGNGASKWLDHQRPVRRKHGLRNEHQPEVSRIRQKLPRGNGIQPHTLNQILDHILRISPAIVKTPDLLSRAPLVRNDQLIPIAGQGVKELALGLVAPLGKALALHHDSSLSAPLRPRTAVAKLRHLNPRADLPIPETPHSPLKSLVDGKSKGIADVSLHLQLRQHLVAHGPRIAPRLNQKRLDPVSTEGLERHLHHRENLRPPVGVSRAKHTRQGHPDLGERCYQRMVAHPPTLLGIVATSCPLLLAVDNLHMGVKIDRNRPARLPPPPFGLLKEPPYTRLVKIPQGTKPPYPSLIVHILPRGKPVERIVERILARKLTHLSKLKHQGIIGYLSRLRDPLETRTSHRKMRADEIRRAVLPRLLRKIQVGLNELPHPKPLRKPADRFQPGPGSVGFLLELDPDFWYALFYLLGASLVRWFSLAQKQTTPRRLSFSMGYQSPLPNSFNPFLLASEIWVQRGQSAFMQYFREIGDRSPRASRESLAVADGGGLNFALGNPERIHLI